MCNFICTTEKGISLVESIVSILLLSTAVIAIMSLQSTSWNTSSRSDYLGRAVMMLHKELMAQESFIMNPCNPVTVGTVDKTVYTSSQTTQQPGDASFNIRTVISAVAGATNTWTVTVTVSGPLRNARTVTDNLIVTRQEYFRFGCI
jgi:Tfp pilus assembly protein PilV